jgi:hypothetical protein
MEYLSICTISKDEDLFPDYRGKTYIDDFVEFHRFIGVEKFYIYDRGFRLFERFKDQSDIEVIYFPEPLVHAQCWQKHIAEKGNKSVWTAFIDVDQFVLPQNQINLQSILSKFEVAGIGAIQPNWKTFGSAGHIKKPFVSQFEAYQYREKESPNGHSILTQSILRANAGELGTLPKNPHQLPLKRGLLSVNSNFIPVQDSPTSSPICYDNLSIAHYLTRSQEEWIFKCSKGRADVVNGFVNMDEFNSRNQCINEILDSQAFDIFCKYASNLYNF